MPPDIIIKISPNAIKKNHSLYKEPEIALLYKESGPTDALRDL